MSRKAYPFTIRISAAIANFKDSHIFVSGGETEIRGRTLKSVEYYSIKADSWSTAPNMNTKRDSHSSCSLGDFVYVSCGSNGNRDTNCVERLNAKKLLAGDSQDIVWEVLQI